MTWLTDNPWPAVFALGIIACALLAIWTSQKRAIWIVGALLAIAAAVAVYFVERSIITEREIVEQKVFDLKDAFVRSDRTAVLTYFSMRDPELRNMALRALDMVEFPN